MTIESEAAADVLTGAVVAGTVEPDTGAHASPRGAAGSACLNCGAALAGDYCASCGQPAHIHRSFVSLGHDILHSVFHFEGKFWRTMPELLFHPGRLTRRYIEGERAKFISPMALFLFTVFLMYAVFAFVPSVIPDLQGDSPAAVELRRGNLAAANVMEERIEELRRDLDDPALTAPERLALEQEVRGLEASRSLMEAIAGGDVARIEELREAAEAAEGSAGERAPGPVESTPAGPDNAFSRAARKLEEDPALMLYKMKSNGYKFSWLMVPLSVPFMWLLFFWRREFRLYDHAVFVTYSISFMTLLLVAIQIADAAGLGGGVQLALMTLVPLHIYKQLRGAYRLSRRGALVRLVFVLMAAMIVISAFFATLFVIGALE